MADKMMRISGRSDEGTAKAINVTDKGILKMTYDNDVFSYYDQTIGNTNTNLRYYFGIDGNGRRETVTPFDISIHPKRMVLIENNTDSKFIYGLCFYNSLEQQAVESYVMRSNEYELDSGDSVLLTNDFEVLGQPFKGLVVTQRSPSNNITGTYNIHMFGGA